MSTGSSDNTGGATADPFLDLTRLIIRLPSEAQALFAIDALRSARARVAPPIVGYGASAGTIRTIRRRCRDRRHPRRRSTRRHRRAWHPHLLRTHRRSNALATSLRARGVHSGASVGIMSRNHRGMLDAIYGTAKAGGRALFLNSDFSGPQAVEVCAREGVEALFYDEEFAEVVSKVDAPKGRFVAWTDDLHGATTGTSVEALISTGNSTPPPAPDKHGKFVVLTSGTTGTPKGADRDIALSLVAPGALLSKIPLHRGEATFIAPPIFHVLGLANVLLATAMGSTMVVRRFFDPKETLIATAEHRCSSLVLVPTILNRLLSLGVETIKQLDLSYSPHHFVQRRAARGTIGDSGDGCIWRHRLQPLRFHRGGLGHDRRTLRPPGCSRYCRESPARYHGSTAR